MDSKNANFDHHEDDIMCGEFRALEWVIEPSKMDREKIIARLDSIQKDIKDDHWNKSEGNDIDDDEHDQLYGEVWSFKWVLNAD